MFVLLNGSFGIGKTTTARVLATQLAEAAISDPEQVGYVLRRLPPWMLGLKTQPDDYQDMALWRGLIGPQARLVHMRAKTVIVPMAFTNLGYLEAFSTTLARTAPVVRLCLVAPLDVIEGRLRQRGAQEGRDGLTAFERRRSAECVAAHTDPAFGVKIDASRPTAQVAEEIITVLGNVRRKG